MRFHNIVTKEAYDKLYRALNLKLDSQRVISFVGAGGKTTLLYTLAEELAALGYRVLVTTTTHMVKPEQNYCEWGEQVHVREGEVLTVGISCGDEKIKGMEGKEYEVLLKQADFLLIEADGSKRMPLKVPAKHEPVLIPETDLVVGVLGFHSVGKKIGEVSHREKEVAAFLNKKQEDMVTVRDLEQISFSKNGLLKGVEPPYQVIWNQWKKEEISLEKKHEVLLCEWEEIC